MIPVINRTQAEEDYKWGQGGAQTRRALPGKNQVHESGGNV